MKYLVFFLLSFYLSFIDTFAQDGGGAIPIGTDAPHLEQSKKRPNVRAVRTTETPKIDGRITEPGWGLAPAFDQFWQQRPNEGEPISEKTEARILFDDEALYISFICYDRQPDKILKRLSRRDREVESDFVGIGLDSYNSKRNGFSFFLNAAGVKMDLLIQNDGQGQPDLNWDAIWDGAVADRPDGWSAEFRIPFRVLRFSPAEVQTWGILLHRHISRSAEDAMSTFIPRSANGFVSHWGHLEGIKNIKPQKAATITPYTLGGMTRLPENQEPAWQKEWTPEYRVGVDAQYGISNNSILTVTVNPDFGQVEADAQELNLTAFETFFPEKRPFFLEGTEIFRLSGQGDGGDGPNNSMFYSRRIGQRPQKYEDYPDGFDLKTGKIVSNPPVTPILGAIKLSGKTDGGFGYGVMNAITPRTFKVLEDAQNRQTRFQTAPLTNYSVFRGQKSLTGAGSYIGGIFTSTLREGMDYANAFSGGFDWVYNTLTYDVSVEGSLLASRRMTEDGIEQGFHGHLWYGSMDHPKLVWQIGTVFSTPGYNANDVGYSQGDNDGFVFLWTQYKNSKPHLAKAQMVRMELVTWHSRQVRPFNFLEQGLFLSPNIEWKSQWRTGLNIMSSLGGLNPYESRGHGEYKTPSNTNWMFNIHSDPRRKVWAMLTPNFQLDTYGKRGKGLDVMLNWNVGEATELSIAPGLSQTRHETGYADTDGNTSGEYAIFGKRDVDFASITLRGTHTFTPDLTFQMYGQYFWARGVYDKTTYKTLDTKGYLVSLPKAYMGNPNFNYSQVNVNAIARYEYRPGSVLFLVWTHGRNHDETDLSLGGLKFLQKTLQTASTNVFLVKLSYTLGL